MTHKSTAQPGLSADSGGLPNANAAIIRPQMVLIIQGIVYSKSSKNLQGEINQFISNLNNNKGFKEDFYKIELKRSYRAKVADTPIMNFRIECTLKR